MIKTIKFLIIFLFMMFILSCSSKNDYINETKTSSPEAMFKKGMELVNNKNLDNAKIEFEKTTDSYPLSNEGIQSEIMIAFIEYSKLNYFDAILKFNKIINTYPSYKDIEYVYYMRALCYYEQIKNSKLDGSYNIKALNNFELIINRFPNSKYSKDSQQKIIFIKENIAAKHMNIAFFYFNQKKYLAALNRYKKVIEDHSKSKFTPEALFRQVEIYYILGMKQEAKKIASVISYNYPKSKWYEYAYNLVNDDKNNLKKSKNSISKKILNLFNRNVTK